MRIVNQDLTSDWADVSLKRTYINGSCFFQTRDGTSFQIRKKGGSQIMTILPDNKYSLPDLKSINNVIFQAKTISGTDTLEMLISGDYYVTPTVDPPSGEWIVDDNGVKLVDSNDEFIYG